MGIFANYGLGGATLHWRDIPVYPSALNADGADMVAGHATKHEADLVIILYDPFAMNPNVLRRLPMPLWFWMPVDCEPMSRPDAEALRISGAQPVAIAQHGFRMMEEARFSPLYIPHGIETDVFCPADQAEARKHNDLPEDAFIIGMNVHNKDSERKGVWEQLYAFSMLHRKHKDVLLQMHTLPHQAMSGNNLLVMADYLGIIDAVRWADPYSLLAGDYTAEDMAKWYNGLDLYSGCSYGEGFGLPLVESQACGIPVVTTNGSAMTELAGPGWLVDGEPHWQRGHLAEWVRPSIGEITAVYEEAYNGGAAGRKAAAREFALGYDADVIAAQYWQPILAEFEKKMMTGPRIPPIEQGWRQLQ